MSEERRRMGFTAALAYFLRRAWVPIVVFSIFGLVALRLMGFLMVLGIFVSYAHWWVMRNKAGVDITPKEMSKKQLLEYVVKLERKTVGDDSTIEELRWRVGVLEDEKANPNLMIKVLGQVMRALIRYDEHRGAVTAEDTIQYLRQKLHALEKKLAEDQVGRQR